MKILIPALTLFTLCIGAHASSVIYPIKSNSPDIMVQFANSISNQSFLVNMIRKIIKEKSQIDPMQFKLEEPIEVIGNLSSDMEKNAKNMVDGFLNFPFNEGKVKIKMEGLNYEIKNAILFIQSVEASNADGINIALTVELSDTMIQAEHISLGFITPPKNKNAYLSKIKIDLDKPYLYSKKLNSLKMKLVYNLKINESNQIEIRSTENTYDVFENITEEELASDITFNPGKAEINDVEIIIGDSHSKLNNEGIKNALQKRKRNIAKLMFDPLVDIIRTIPSKILKEKLESLVLPSSFDFPFFYKTMNLKLHSFGNVTPEQFRFAFDSNWSGRIKHIQDAENFEKSEMNIQTMIEQEKSEMVISLNQDLFSDIAIDLVNGKFKASVPNRISMGEQGIRFKMKEINQGIIAADVDVNIGLIGKIALGKRHLQIPVFITPKIEVVEIDNIPTLKVSIEQIDLSNETLLFGKEEFKSNLNKIRFKKLVLKKLKKKFLELKNSVKISVPFKQLAGFDPRILNIQSDGFGRLNLYFSLNPNKGMPEKKFWVLVPKFFK